MSILAYTGLPGAGKSYAAVEHQILPALRQARHVVTNVPLDQDRIRIKCGGGIIDEFPIQAILAEPHRIFEFALPGCLLVIDELWRLFPAGVKSNNVPEPFKKLLAEHRHMVDASGNSMQIVFVTQDLSQIAAFARQLVEQTFVIRKLSHLGFSKRYTVDVFHGAVTGASPPVTKRLRQIHGSYSQSVWQFYRSHTMSEAVEGGANEKSIDRRAVVWRSPVWWLGAPAVLALGVWGVSSAIGIFGGDSPPDGATAAAVGGGPSLVRDGVGAGRGPRGSQSSAPVQRPRVTGYVDVEGDPLRSIVTLTDGVESWLIRFSDGCSWHRYREIRCQWDGRTYRGHGAAFVPAELRESDL